MTGLDIAATGYLPGPTDGNADSCQKVALWTAQSLNNNYKIISLNSTSVDMELYPTRSTDY